eukprot:TRINITY_DN85449_c0_g1_i1.p1 TRINITY_DN85449_c0_g1~~TRINITY_DN85449_c0_g1_i1.p1  ORF type:complete len:217 (-),score=28.24 TRINITY_DN85449_c0_g1_i1:123-773(-)
MPEGEAPAGPVAGGWTYMNDTGSPWINAVIWKGECAKELDSWAATLSKKKSGVVEDFYRVPMPGEVVHIRGMQRRSELNGAMAEVISNALDECGRITVRVHQLDGATKRMQIQANRLEPLAGSKPFMGQTLALSGSKSAASLGHGGSRMSDDGRSIKSAGSVFSVATSYAGGPRGPAHSVAGSALSGRPLSSAISAGARGSLGRLKTGSTGYSGRG